MDRHKASWILEFVLRQPVEDWLAKDILRRLPIPTPLDPHLKRILLLRCLSSHLSSDRLSDNTLKCLEILEELDRSLGATQASENLRAAYAAVAAELTAAPLRSGDRARFLAAVMSFWECRVVDLERSEASGMVGEGLTEWRRRMAAAAAASDAAGELVLQGDTRGQALEALRLYVRAALKEMGPSLLELAARGAGGKPDAGGDEGPHQITDEREAAGLPGVSAEPSAAVGAATRVSAPVDSLASVNGAEGAAPLPETERRKQSRISEQAGTSGEDGISKVTDFLPLREANKLKEALKSSCADLQKAVEDPLPNALKRAVELHNGTSAPGFSIQNDAQTGVTRRSAVQDRNGIPYPPKQRPSLMDRNPTARSYEWDEDSIEAPSDSSPNSLERLHLPTPMNRRASPLQIQEIRKFVRKRKIKRWTPQEEDVLREAVQKHGKGNWKCILQLYSEAFEDRTEVDLKDKWRNLTR